MQAYIAALRGLEPVAANAPKSRRKVAVGSNERATFDPHTSGEGGMPTTFFPVA
jgi:hypothetical protein